MRIFAGPKKIVEIVKDHLRQAFALMLAERQPRPVPFGSCLIRELRGLQAGGLRGFRPVSLNPRGLPWEPGRFHATVPRLIHWSSPGLQCGVTLGESRR